MNNAKKFIPYILFGYPTVNESFNKALEFANIADIYEIGFPFSDPVADGRVIVNAARKALLNKITFNDYIKFIENLKKKVKQPVYAMTYYNPVLKYGLQKFAKSAIDGFIIPDLIIEESRELLKAAIKYNKKSVFIVTPDTPDERIKKIAAVTTGFIYFVTYPGITGKNVILKQNIFDKIKKIKQLTDRAIYIGFGIKTPADLQRIYSKSAADGAIIGSAILNNSITAKEISTVKNKFQK